MFQECEVVKEVGGGEEWYRYISNSNINDEYNQNTRNTSPLATHMPFLHVSVKKKKNYLCFINRHYYHVLHTQHYTGFFTLGTVRQHHITDIQVQCLAGFFCCHVIIF